jgi:hypothetical protein
LKSLENLAFSPHLTLPYSLFAMAVHMRIDLHQRAKIRA